MARQQYLTNKGQFEEVHGSDTRINTSDRSSTRSYYVSRDKGQAFTVTSHDATAAAGTYPIYLQNTSTVEKLFIDKIEVGGVETALWKMWFVTGTASGSSALTAINLNKTSSNAAAVTARGDGPVSSLTTDGEIWSLRSSADSSTEENFDDTIILGQNDAIAVEIDTDDASPNIAEVTIRFYLE